MKLYWLKRLALKWLVNDINFYNIMTALRGPDIDTFNSKSGIVKEYSTCRIRGKVGMKGFCTATVETGTPQKLHRIAMEHTVSLEGDKWDHFGAHISSAIDSLQKVGYKWQL